MLRGKVDPKKEEQERLQGFLLEMLKEDENKYCADCQAKTPRWAAWNLGIFICIRCAGIHRNLGVHISKVRSVNLDSWTPEQVQTMRVMGNEKARLVYEHDLPASFRRPSNDQQMEGFIRTKYEQKRYMLRDFVYPKVDVNDLPKTLAQSSRRAGAPVVSIATLGTAAVTNNGSKPPAPSMAPSLLDFTDEPAITTPAKKPVNLFDDFEDLTLNSSGPTTAKSGPAPNDDFDDFGSFVSASAQPSAATSASLGSFADFSSAPTLTTTNTTASSGLNDLAALSATENGGDKKKTNADILSLFGSGGGKSASNVVAPGGFAGFGLQAAPQQKPLSTGSFPAFGVQSAQQISSAQQNDTFGGLSGINFGNSASSAPMTMSHNPISPQSFVPSFGTTSINQNTCGLAGLTSSTLGSKAAPTSPTSTPGFNIPNKSNAFADLALGKVMKTNYGQSALNAVPAQSIVKRASPLPIVTPLSSTPTTTTAAKNDLFDLFASAPPPVPMTVNSSSGLDDLLRL